jgi:hypothetical protein
MDFDVDRGMTMAQKLEFQYQNVVNNEFEILELVMESHDLQLKLILQVVDSAL